MSFSASALNIFCFTFLIVFALICGFLLGMGNTKGLLGSILPGLLGGLLALKFWDQPKLALLFLACSIVGSSAASFVGETNRIKQFCLEQKALYISLPFYRLGSKSEDSDRHT